MDDISGRISGALRELRDKSKDRGALSIADFIHVIEEELPKILELENRHRLSSNQVCELSKQVKREDTTYVESLEKCRDTLAWLFRYHYKDPERYKEWHDGNIEDIEKTELGE